MDAELAELATEARVLDTSERETRVGCDHAVDEQQSGLDLGDKPIALGVVTGPCGRTESETGPVRTAAGVVRGPGGGTESEIGPVGNPDGVANVAGLEHGGDRAEQLVVAGRRSRRNIRENRRLVEITLAIDLRSAGQNARPRVD